MNIFIIDDDPDMIELLNVMLSHLGHLDVHSASDGKLALQILSRSSAAYDCILVDIDMPDLNGVDLCKLLRSDPSFMFTPILIMTALLDKKTVDHAFRSGATDYINKPFSIAELETRLRMVKSVNDKRQNQEVLSVDYPSLNVRPVNRFTNIKVDSIENLIDYSALCNYLAHLSLAGLESRQVVAVIIDKFGEVIRRSSKNEMDFFLSEIAEVISNSYQKQDCMMAYCGEGTFIVVSDKSNFETSLRMEAKIYESLNAIELEYDNGIKLDLDVSIGNPIRPNTSKTQRIRKTFDRAIARAESKSMRKMSKGYRQVDSFHPGLKLIEGAK